MTKQIIDHVKRMFDADLYLGLDGLGTLGHGNVMLIDTEPVVLARARSPAQTGRTSAAGE